MAERSKPKKAFEHRMSKKVAELTQVVHLLFTRNHEREVEVQLLKKLYNEELDQLHEQYRIQLEKEAADHKAQLRMVQGHKQNEDSEKNRLMLVIMEAEETNKQLIARKDAELYSEKLESQKLRDMLMKAKQDLEKLKHTIDTNSESHGTDLSNKDKDIEKLKKQTDELEKQLEARTEHMQRSLEAEREALRRNEQEVRNLRTLLSQAQAKEEHSENRSKMLEQELKASRQDLSRRLQEISSLRQSAVNTPSSATLVSQDLQDEVESLRRLVKRYRLELSNREGNFNRMFTEKTPVVIDQRSVKVMGKPPQAPPFEKTYPYSRSLHIDSAEEINKNKLPSMDGNRSMSSHSRNVPGKQLLAHYAQNFWT